MKKFRVTVNTCPAGHLRYGHYEGIVEAESADEIREKLSPDHARDYENDIFDYLNYVADDYEVESDNLDEFAVRSATIEELPEGLEVVKDEPAERHPIICYEDVPKEILDHFIPISALDAHLEKFSIADGSTVKVTIAAVKSDWITGTAEERKALVDNELTRPVLTAEGVHNELGTAVLEGLKSIFDSMRGKS